ncbi:MAG TPA: MFS transporter [Gammaproteobacteria bacterium]|nr:MFS transporter [Gammaproteobacteria bacterium]
MQEGFRTDIPARLDRLRWSRFHTLLVLALGTGWVIDGLEVTLVGSLAAVLTLPTTLNLTPAQIGETAAAYVVGAVIGSLVFGALADRYGRRRLFFITLGVYAVAAAASGMVSSYWPFVLTRFFTGAGIGGEYAAINSAIQEFIPARLRGRVDLAVNGSFWVGAAFGAIGATVVLDTTLVPEAWGWRLAFIIGGALALIVMAMRRFIPESPRWLMVNGRQDEAEAIVRRIEQQAGTRDDTPIMPPLTLFRQPPATWWTMLIVLARRYPRRTVLGLTLMAAQAFLYNAIFFTYALILTRYYDVDARSVGLYLVPFAVGNVLGPLLLGPLFDLWGRRVMITSTYAITGVLILATGQLFVNGMLDATTQTIAWSIVFFFASAAASSAYLTVSEVFPLEVRARAIAWFYSVATALGGISGPLIFGHLIASGARIEVFWGYALGGGLMLIGAIVAWRTAVAAERRPLEAVAAPLSALLAETRHRA